MVDIQAILDKVKGKARNFRFFVQQGNNTQGSIVVKQMEVCTSPSYPNFLFVIFENMIYRGDELVDSSYSIYSFNAQGDYIEEVRIQDLPKTFIADRNTITLI